MKGVERKGIDRAIKRGKAAKIGVLALLCSLIAVISIGGV